MAASIGKGLPPLKFGANKGKVIHEKQGIVTILGSDLSEQCKAPSLRRTLSADMSSKKWLSQNGMKKVASSKDLNDEEHKNSNNQIGSWSSLLCGKINKDKVKGEEEEKTNLPSPYIHPLEKKSSTPLSEKSLEICTENLGSETGSDIFSSYSSSDTEDTEEENHKVKVPQSEPESRPRYNYCIGKRSRSVSFPPPIPSLHVQSHREDGRLVLEVVSLPSQNCFQAQREDGRLVLTFANNEDQNENEKSFETTEDEETLVDEDEETLDGFESDEDVGEEEGSSKWYSSGQVVDAADKSRAILMKEIMVVDEVNQAEDNGPWSLFSKPVNNKKKVENKLMLSMSGGNNLGSFMMVPFFKGCKELRRSLVMLEPYCIASS